MSNPTHPSMKKAVKPRKTYKVRMLTAVIEVDEDGNEDVTPATLDIPVEASSPDEAAGYVQDAIKKLVPNPRRLNKELEDLMRIMQLQKTQAQKSEAKKIESLTERRKRMMKELQKGAQLVPQKARDEQQKKEREDLIKLLKDLASDKSKAKF